MRLFRSGLAANMSLASVVQVRNVSLLLHGKSHQWKMCSSCCMHQKLQQMKNSTLCIPVGRTYCKDFLSVRKAGRKCQWISGRYFSASGNDSSGNVEGPDGRSLVHRVRLSNHLPRSKRPWRVLFFGTDLFSLKMLKTLNENR